MEEANAPGRGCSVHGVADRADGQLGTGALVSIGVGGMVGGGIFAVTGLTIDLTHGAAPLAFVVAGLVAGHGGAVVLAAAALAATSSAINATYCGSGRLTYLVGQVVPGGRTRWQVLLVGGVVALSWAVEAAYRSVTGRQMHMGRRPPPACGGAGTAGR